MAHLYIPQTVFGQSSSSGTTLTWPNAPRVGNTAVLMITGFNTQPGVPSNWTLISANPNDSGNNGSWVYSKIITASDVSAGSVTLTYCTDQKFYCLQEVNGQPSITVAHGGCSESANGSGYQVLTGSLIGYSTRTIRQLFFEWDQQGPTPTTPSGATQISPSSWLAIGNNGYHAGVAYSLQAAVYSGQYAVNFSQSLNYPVWLDVVYTAQGPAVTQLGSVTTNSTGSPTFRVNNAPASGTTLIVLGVGADTAWSVSGFTYVGGKTGPASNGIGVYSLASPSSSYQTVTINTTTSTVKNFFICELSPESSALTAGISTNYTASSGVYNLASNSNGAVNDLALILIGWQQRGDQPIAPSWAGDLEASLNRSTQWDNTYPDHSGTCYLVPAQDPGPLPWQANGVTASNVITLTLLIQASSNTSGQSGRSGAIILWLC